MMTEASVEKLEAAQKALLARKQLEASIILRAWQDDEFRQRLFNDPRAAVEEMGMEVPEGMSVSVVEEPATAWQIAVPPRPYRADELTEAQLQQVAGGYWRGLM